MEKIYSVGSSDNKALRELGYEILDFSLISGSDSDLHDFVLGKIRDLDFDKLIIELYRDDLKSLKLAYHIRLTLDALRAKSLLPILFVSERSLSQILSENGIWGQIFSTRGVTWASYSSAGIEIEHLAPISTREYRTGFLNLINVMAEETVGKHSLANEWGALALARAANTHVLDDDPDVLRTATKLYFKYSEASIYNYERLRIMPNDVPRKIRIGDTIRINAVGCKILLIDDEADRGWERVLRQIFKTTSDVDFQVVCERVSGYDALSEKAKNLIEQNSFDLFLIDLRLHGINEEEVVEAKDFSGTSILNKVKLNRGNQVIIFTASNKAWNLNPLLTLGADAYYIKESPEYQFSSKFSKENFDVFRETAEKLLKRRYIKEVFEKIEFYKKRIHDLKVRRIYESQFLDELVNLLNQSFDMHYRASEGIHFAYAYVTLYMIVERINSEFVIVKGDDKEKVWYVGKAELKEWSWNASGKKYNEGDAVSKERKPAESKKMIGIWKQKFAALPPDDIIIRPVEELVRLRNDFIHNNVGLDPKIYSAQGFQELFKLICSILARL